MYATFPPLIDRDQPAPTVDLHGVTQTPANEQEPSKWVRVLLLLLGIILGQILLYGPSLIGQKILLPLDILAGKGFYLPQTPEYAGILAKDPSVSDLVLQSEPARRFAVSELKAGRLPQWTPYQYGGAPFIAMPLLSPFTALQCSTASPVVLAWSQLLLALVAGVGAYGFFRSVLHVGFWPAAFGAWLFPLSGFFILWQGFNLTQALAWLPWVLLAVDRAVRGGSRWAVPGLAAATCVVLNTQLDVAGQVLLTSGLYALWCMAEVRHEQPAHTSVPGSSVTAGAKARWLLRVPVDTRWAIGRLCASWALGLLLAAPYILPVLAYTRTGSRMAHRASGNEERPPIGLTALPQLLLPDIYGTRQPPSLRYGGGPTQQESSAAGYVGLLTALVAAPLAFCSRRHLRANLLWLALSFLALSWCLNVPGLVNLLRLPGLRMMSHNRWVFLDSFALLALAVTGLDALMKRSVQWRAWMWSPLALLLALCVWCAVASHHPPQAVANMAAVVAAGQPVDWIHDLPGAQRALAWFSQYYSCAAIVSGLGALGWLLLRTGRLGQRRLGVLLGTMQAAELCWFAYGRNVQSSPSLYYPRIPVLQELVQAAPGRVMGFGCLPAILSSMCDLRDIRGYDAVDPDRMVALVLGAADSTSIQPRYARTKQLAPKATITPTGDIQLPPVLDMLSVRYVIFRGAPFPTTHPFLQGLDYWVLQNPRALPRAYVPARIETVADDAARLTRLEADDYDPRAVAFIETPVQLPEHCAGTAAVMQDLPKRVTLVARMQTPGMVVLADLWDNGWRAFVDGRSAPVLRANHAVRGVILPVGTHRVEFRYEAASFKWGLAISVTALLLVLGWAAWRRKTNEPQVCGSESQFAAALTAQSAEEP